MEQTTVTNEITIYNNAIETFRGGGEILARNQATVSKALAAGQSILAKVEANGGKLTAELDSLSNNYLVLLSQRKKELEDGRKPVTQMMDVVKKMFTSEEAKLDITSVTTIPYQVQQHRNTYAKEQAGLEKKRQEEGARKAAKERERVQLTAVIDLQLNEYFNNYMLNYKQQMQAGFNAITLDNYLEKEQKLTAIPCLYKYEHYTAFTISSPLTRIYHTDADLSEIMTGVTIDKYDVFAARFKQEIEELKQQLIDRLPSKKAELEAMAAAEKARKDEEERAKEAERLRQEEIKKADGERRKQLEEQGRKDAEADRKRQEDLRAEQQKLETERLQREQEEQDRITREAEEAKRKAEQEIEMQKAAGETLALFDKEAMLADGAAAPEARQGFEITVQHAAGYVQIFQFWFENEGKNLGLDKMGNTKLDQMKAWCEKHAHKTGEVIDSKFLQYEPTYKAVNRKV